MNKGAFMIQFLLPVVAFAAILTGCSKKDDSSEPAETGTPPSGEQAEQAELSKKPEVYKLKDFVIHDNNRDGYLDGGDAVFHIHPKSHQVSKVDRSFPELQAFLQKLNHHEDRPLRLEGARQYLRIHNWTARDPHVADWGGPEFTGNNAERQMDAFENAEDFAFENGLEFAGEGYLTEMRNDLEELFSPSCTSGLDSSMRSFVETGDSGDYWSNHQRCEKLAIALDLYFGQNKSSEIDASRQQAISLGIPERTPLKALGGADW